MLFKGTKTRVEVADFPVQTFHPALRVVCGSKRLPERHERGLHFLAIIKRRHQGSSGTAPSSLVALT